MTKALTSLRNRMAPRGDVVLDPERGIASPAARSLGEAISRVSRGVETKSIGPTSADETFFQSMRLKMQGAPMERPMEQHESIYAAIHALAMNVSQTALCVRPTGRPLGPIPTNRLTALLDDPNPLMSPVDLSYFVVAYLSLDGECMIVKEGSDGQHLEDRFSVPTELWPLSGRHFTHFVDPVTKLVNYWVYCMGSTDEVVYKPHEVIHVKYPNPYSPYRGLAPMAAAANVTAADWQAMQYNRAVLENGGDPGGVIESEKPLTPDQRVELESKWESRFSGASKKGRVAVLSGGLKYTSIAASARDMQFMEGRNWNADKIFQVFRVPPSEAGVYKDVNYSTADVEARRFWRRTLVPIMRLIQDALWAGMFCYVEDGRYMAYYDVSQVPELRTDVDAKLDTYERMTSLGWTPDQAVQTAGLDLPVNPWQRKTFKEQQESGSLPSPSSSQPALPAPVPTDVAQEPASDAVEPVEVSASKIFSVKRALRSIVSGVASGRVSVESAMRSVRELVPTATEADAYELLGPALAETKPLPETKPTKLEATLVVPEGAISLNLPKRTVTLDRGDGKPPIVARTE